MLWIWLFLLYSFLGFLIEVLFVRLVGHPKRDRKCLYFLPLCPVYGVGALCILALPASVLANPWLLYLMGGAAATAAEYGCGLFYERVLSVPFWDYNHLPANLGGRVCFLFSALWGVLALGLVHLAQSVALHLVAGIPPQVTAVWAVVFAADAAYSACLLRQARHTDCLRWKLAARLRPSPAPEWPR